MDEPRGPGGGSTSLAERLRDDMYRFIETVLTEIGPRESCSENERRLGRRLEGLWRQQGHDVRREAFACRPKAFLGFIPAAALLYLLSISVYWMSPLLCVFLAGVSLVVVWFELLRYRELIDPLFPEATGENVLAVVAPAGEVRQRVYVSAHQDSAYEFNLWFFLKNAAIPIMVIALVAPLVPFVGALIHAVLGAGAGVDRIGYWSWGLYPIVGLNLFFHTYSVVPGAMDNLAGISVLTGVGAALARDGAADPWRLQHTEVVLFATSSEEAGLRGAKRYVSAHADELRRLPTYGIFVDGVYDERFLTVVPRELTTGARHDPRLVRLAHRVAAARGWRMREHMIPFGGTDGAAFSLGGVPSVVLLCQDMSRLAPNYHTRLDVIDHVRPESLAVMLQLVLDMLDSIDTGNEL